MGKRSSTPGERDRAAPAAAPSGRDEPHEDDAALFRAAIGRVRELPAAPPPPRAAPPRPAARMAARDEDDARSEFQRALDGRSPATDTIAAGDALRHRSDELPPRLLQRLRRGQYSVQDEIDLHHCDASRAEALLRRFLNEAVDQGLGCVRVIHGKGLHSDTGVPVLKNLVDRVLRQRADVLGFHSAPPAQGGHGAVLVLLRRRAP